MLVLDTNILYEIVRFEPERKVADWIVRQPSDALFTAAVCQAEILSGLAVMPAGRCRAELEAAARAMFADDFDGRVLPFDIEAASALQCRWQRICRTARKPGRSLAAAFDGEEAVDGVPVVGDLGEGYAGQAGLANGGGVAA